MMKNKITVILLVFLIFAGLSISTISSAEYQGNLQFSNDGGQIKIGGGNCEDWSSSFWNDCTNNVQTFICIQSNPSCPTQELKPSQCGQTKACGEVIQPTGGSGGGGGGGSGSAGGGGGIVTLNTQQTTSDSGESENNDESSCTENWQCGEWSNPEDACGTRICSDVNQCSTEELKPFTEVECPNTILGSITGAFSAGINNFAKSGPLSKILIIIIIATVTILGIRTYNKRRNYSAPKM